MLAVFNLCSAKALQPDITHAFSSIRAAPSSAAQAAFSAPGAAYSCFSTLHNTILEACPIPQNAHIILPSEGDFDWEESDYTEWEAPVDIPFSPEETHNQLPFLPIEIAATFSDAAVCLTTEGTEIGDCIALGNIKSSEHDPFEFTEPQTEFALDNCATHHVCAELALFIGPLRSAVGLGVKGVNGIARAGGIGSIQIKVKNSQGKETQITLHNVIYLPNSAKNLISISRWSADRKDDCGIFSREKYSIFLWNNDTEHKYVPHNPYCKIPVMLVNEGANDNFSAFLASYGSNFCDNVCLLAGSHLSLWTQKSTRKMYLLWMQS